MKYGFIVIVFIEDLNGYKVELIELKSDNSSLEKKVVVNINWKVRYCWGVEWMISGVVIL